MDGNIARTTHKSFCSGKNWIVKLCAGARSGGAAVMGYKSRLLIGVIDAMTDRGHAIYMFPIHEIGLGLSECPGRQIMCMISLIFYEMES
jgi:hypothetical protein